MDPWPHIIETRERLIRVETELDRLRPSRTFAERVGWNGLSRNLVIAIAFMWALATGREEVAVQLLGLL